jgi:hypothetical protein
MKRAGSNSKELNRLLPNFPRLAAHLVQYISMSSRDNIRLRKLVRHEPDTDYQSMTPGKRMELVWLLTVDAWAFMGKDIAEQRLQRDVVRIIRRKR